MLFDAKVDIHLWAEAISHANWLRNRLPAQRANFEIPYTLWTGKRPNLSNLLRFGQPGYTFQYKPITVKGKKFLPRTIYGRFVGMESEHSLYQIFIPVAETIYIFRRNDFTVLKENTDLPTFSTLMENISRQQQLIEAEETDEEEIEEVQSKCYFSHYTQIPTALKVSKENRIPQTFQEACRITNWANAIDREYNSLIDRSTWEYVKIKPHMKPIPFIWNFRIKDTVGSTDELLYKARCCLRGDKQVAYRDFDPETLYAPVVRHETIRIFIVKSAAQGLIVEGADVDNAYLYGNINNGMTIIMQQPTNSTGIPTMPGHFCRLQKYMYC